jgi:hypothetical protein
MNVVGLPMDVEFSIHAAALAIQNLNRDELEEAFVELLHQKSRGSTDVFKHFERARY